MANDNKRILLCACGLTPQIVTETLYALCVKEGGFIPDEVHLITTRTGQMLAEERLLHPEDGRFHRFCAEYGLSGRIRLDSGTIHTIADSSGPLEDIRNAAENLAASASILRLVRDLIAESSVLHASLAGGRKTMGFYLGAAMQLFGRECDELSHVLVSAPFESHPEFFYPPKTPRSFQFQDRMRGTWATISSDEAHIELAHLPYVRLGCLLPGDLDTDLPLEGMMELAQRHVDQDQLELWIDLSQNTLTIGGETAKLSPMEMQVYHWLITQRHECAKTACGDCMDCYTASSVLTNADRIDFTENAYGDGSGKYAMAREMEFKDSEMSNWFNQKRSSINRTLKKLRHGHLVEIKSDRAYGNTRYGLPLPPGRIKYAVGE